MSETNITEIKTLNGYPLADTKARADMATLSKEVEGLKEEGGISGGTTTTMSGALITMDCDEGSEITVDGDATGEVTLVHCGKNLMPKYAGVSVAVGVSITQNADGTVHFEGTSVGEAWPNHIPKASPMYLPAGTYTMTVEGTLDDLTFVFCREDGSTIVGFFPKATNYSKTKTFTLNAGTRVWGNYTIGKAGLVLNNDISIMLEAGGEATRYEKTAREVHAVTFPYKVTAHDGVNTLYTESGDVLTATAKKTVAAIISEAVEKQLATDCPAYGTAVLTLDGDCTGMTKDDYVPLAYTFQGRSGTVQVKKQGTSSIGVGQEIGAGFDDDLGGLFNFTLKFPEAFEAKAGWGAHDKYCFKANAIDHSHLRNVGGAKLWGQVVKSRPMLTAIEAHAVNGVSYHTGYEYANGVWTNNVAMTQTRRYINGYTVPPGNYNITFDAFLPEGAENLLVRVTLATSEAQYTHPTATLKAAGVWETVTAWGADAATYTGPIYLSIEAQAVAGLKFRNVSLKNRDTGEIIKLPPPAWQIKDLPNAGAVDGFPCTIVLNGKYYMTGTFNIPKDGWMYGMGNGEKEAILCAEGTDNCYMTGTASIGADYELEYVSDEGNSGWVQTSLDALISAAVNSDGTDLDTTIAQYLDWDSAIDMMIFLSLIGGFDLKKKNYLLVTYDGKKWMMGAYDMDSIWGNWWTGLEFFSSTRDMMTSIDKLTQHRLYYLIRHHKLDAFKARYAELRAGVLSESNVEWTLTNFAAGMPSALLDANTKRWPRLRSTNANNLAQILNWYRLRCQAIDAEVAAL